MKLKNKMNNLTLKKKIIISIVSLAVLAEIIYMIILFIENINSFEIQCISLVRTVGVFIFFIIPFINIFRRKINFTTFLYFFSFEAGFDFILQSFQVQVLGM